MIFALNHGESGAEFQDALAKGLNFSTGRNLMGPGFEATEWQLETLGIYKKAGLYEFLKTHGDEYAPFRDLINKIIEGYRQALAANSTIRDFAREFRKEFEAEVNEYDTNLMQNVWYAVYGSNINTERFMKYIERCSDKTAPAQSKPLTIAHDIYFASKSIIWESKGVAFLDDSQPGMAFGKMYLITYEQFVEIQQFEGGGYRKKVLLGTEGNLPIYTFTSPIKRSDINAPSEKYFNTILDGLKETYPELSEITFATYLLNSGVVDKDDLKILSFIRNSEHGVTLLAVINYMGVVTKTKNSIKKLVKLGILKQDSRSIAAGHKVTDDGAVFYTNKDKRDAIVLLLIMNR